MSSRFYLTFELKKKTKHGRYVNTEQKKIKMAVAKRAPPTKEEENRSTDGAKCAILSWVFFFSRLDSPALKEDFQSLENPYTDWKKLTFTSFSYLIPPPPLLSTFFCALCLCKRRRLNGTESRKKVGVSQLPTLWFFVCLAFPLIIRKTPLLAKKKQHQQQ